MSAEAPSREVVCVTEGGQILVLRLFDGQCRTSSTMDARLRPTAAAILRDHPSFPHDCLMVADDSGYLEFFDLELGQSAETRFAADWAASDEVYLRLFAEEGLQEHIFSSLCVSGQELVAGTRGGRLCALSLQGNVSQWARRLRRLPHHHPRGKAVLSLLSLEAHRPAGVGVPTRIVLSAAEGDAGVLAQTLTQPPRSGSSFRFAADDPSSVAAMSALTACRVSVLKRSSTLLMYQIKAEPIGVSLLARVVREQRGRRASPFRHPHCQAALESSDRPVLRPQMDVHNKTVPLASCGLTEGAQLATGGRDGTIRVWAAGESSLTEARAFSTSPVSGVCVTVPAAADGSWLLSGCEDGTVNLWSNSRPGAAPWLTAKLEQRILFLVRAWKMMTHHRFASLADHCCGKLFKPVCSSYLHLLPASRRLRCGCRRPTPCGGARAGEWAHTVAPPAGTWKATSITSTAARPAAPGTCRFTPLRVS